MPGRSREADDARCQPGRHQAAGARPHAQEPLSPARRHQHLARPLKPALGLRIARTSHRAVMVPYRGTLQPQARHVQDVTAAPAPARQALRHPGQKFPVSHDRGTVPQAKRRHASTGGPGPTSQVHSPRYAKRTICARRRAMDSPPSRAPNRRSAPPGHIGMTTSGAAGADPNWHAVRPAPAAQPGWTHRTPRGPGRP